MRSLKSTILLSAVFFSAVSLMAQPMQMPNGEVPKSSLKFEDYFTKADAKVVAKPDDQGFIRRWTLLDPISKPNRSNTVFTDSYLREVFAKEYFPNQLTILPKDGQKMKVTVLPTSSIDPEAFPFPFTVLPEGRAEARPAAL